MRSTFSGLNTMVRGINANQLSENTVGHNISNANTEGYSRQKANLAAVRAQSESSIYGQVLVGKGVDSMSLTRARDIYADRQYWDENSTNAYYESRQKEYDKIEAIFNDTTNEGLQTAGGNFFQAWVDLNANPSVSANRISVIEKGNVYADRIHTAAQQLQGQIDSNYKDIELTLTKVNDYTDQIVELNFQIMSNEANGASANDLRDQRDLLVDKLSGYVNLNIYESANGMYSVVSNGVSLVNGMNKLTLEMSEPITNKTYGINDYSVIIKESGIAYMPTNGQLKAQMDQIAEDKEYIDYLARMSAFLLTTFNDQHHQGIGIDNNPCEAVDSNGDVIKNQDGTETTGTAGVNFYGKSNVLYTWDETTQSVKTQIFAEDHGWTTEVTVDKDADGKPIQSDDGRYSTTVTCYDKAGTAEIGDDLKGINIIETLNINKELTGENGEKLVAAAGWYATFDQNGNVQLAAEANGTHDGANAAEMENLLNGNQENTKDTESVRSIGIDSLNAYYNKRMTALGSRAETMDSKVVAQNEVMTQITEWRQSVAGVNWNEELSNMIMFQQGFSACSRCLTTMDEMLDRLINSTGMVGR